MHRTSSGIIGGLVAGLLLANCGGSSPAAPSSSGTGSFTGAANPDITVTITSSGVSPNPLRVSQGTRVLFVNNDSRSHEMSSDSHPEHTECTEINNVGFISPGQTKETGNLNLIRTCGYHDHNDPDNTRFQGRIIIQ